MRITLNHEPIPQKRHRSATRGKKIWHYNPCGLQKENIKKQLKNLLYNFEKDNPNEHAKFTLLTCDFYQLKFKFYMKMPNFSKKKGILANWGVIPCSKKPDLDNLEKFYLDCMNGIFFKDDAQIVALNSTKRYSLHPRVEIEIKGLKMNVDKQAQEILSLISPIDFERLTTLTHQLNSEYFMPEEIEENAYVLSEIADNFSDIFSKIAKKFPKHYEKRGFKHDA